MSLVEDSGSCLAAPTCKTDTGYWRDDDSRVLAFQVTSVRLSLVTYWLEKSMYSLTLESWRAAVEVTSKVTYLHK